MNSNDAAPFSNSPYDIPSHDLPGMWDSSDFMGGATDCADKSTIKAKMHDLDMEEDELDRDDVARSAFREEVNAAYLTVYNAHLQKRGLATIAGGSCSHLVAARVTTLVDDCNVPKARALAFAKDVAVLRAHEVLAPEAPNWRPVAEVLERHLEGVTMNFYTRDLAVMIACDIAGCLRKR